MPDNIDINARKPVRRVIDPDRLRDVQREQLPDIMQQKEAERARQAEERMRQLRARFESQTSQAGSDDGVKTDAAEPVTTVEDAAPTSPRTKRGSVKRRKEYLEPKQHARLRDQIEHLWAVDKRFRNWSLLAKAAGLSSGQAVKRAYEVNSSMATLRNIDTFARLHAGFGSRATRALKSGVSVEQLQAHLTGGGVEPEEQPRTASSNRHAAAAPKPTARKPAAPKLSMDELGDTPPAVDFDSLLEVGKAVDIEVKRLWLVAHFFEQVAARSELPGLVRGGAATAREHVLKAVAQFASNGGASDGA